MGTRPKPALIPSSVKILGKRYSVQVVLAGHEGLKAHPDDEEPGVGCCHPDKQEIYIESGQHIDQLADCLLHEILHGIEHGSNIECDEDEIRALASGILAVLRDNPRLFPFLRRKS